RSVRVLRVPGDQANLRRPDRTDYPVPEQSADCVPRPPAVKVATVGVSNGALNQSLPSSEPSCLALCCENTSLVTGYISSLPENRGWVRLLIDGGANDPTWYAMYRHRQLRIRHQTAAQIRCNAPLSAMHRIDTPQTRAVTEIS